MSLAPTGMAAGPTFAELVGITYEEATPETQVLECRVKCRVKCADFAGCLRILQRGNPMPFILHRTDIGVCDAPCLPEKPATNPGS
ncbi:MAG: hypothetical protein JWO91_1464 [Acidobacteriaceae bacterium]|nr:hypothetical protein [Acidobacteriaceae bacterium]